MNNNPETPDPEADSKDPDFRMELERVINSFSRENGSDTPDFILAEYLIGCLDAYDKALQKRQAWYGLKIGSWHEPKTLGGPASEG